MILNIVAPVFIIIIVGFVLGKFYKKLDADSLVAVLVYITVPALIVTSISKSPVQLAEFFQIIAIGSLIVLISGGLLYVILRIFKSNMHGLYLPLTIGNTGYLGYPIALAAFGGLGLSRAIVYDVTSSIFLFSIGIFIVHSRNELKEIFKIPLIYALAAGILLNVLKISLPEIVFKPLEMIGSITIPLALIVLGHRLASIKISHLKISLLASLFKIVGGFLIALVVVLILKLDSDIAKVIILQAAMPSAVMSMILCHKYKRDSDVVTSIVMVSTILSVLTIPLVIYFLMNFRNS